jgi:hypothetical protein
MLNPEQWQQMGTILLASLRPSVTVVGVTTDILNAGLTIAISP